MKFHIENFFIKNLSGIYFYFFAGLRAIYLTLKGFVRDRGGQSASSFTYYTLLAIVPILAISFAIAEGLGFREFLENGLAMRFRDQTEVLEKIMVFTNNFLEIAKSGLVTVLGFSILFISAFKLLSNLEEFFQNLWKVKRKRKWGKRILIYFLMILTVPSFLIFSGAFKVLFFQKPFYFFTSIYFLFPYIFTGVLFTLIYFFMPHKKLKFFSCLIAGILIGIIFEFIEWGYIYFQIKASRYNAIYGSFASIPLFLIWLQLSWIVFLFGAYLSYFLQNLRECEYKKISSKISNRYKLLLSCLFVFEGRDRLISNEYLYEKLNIPYALFEIVIGDLLSAKIFKKVIKRRKVFFKLAKNIDTLTFKRVLDDLNFCGVNNLKFIRSKLFEKLKRVLERGNLEKTLIKNLEKF
jgi:membrane protein